MTQPAPDPSSKPSPQELDGLRWQAYFQASAEPLFFLNRRRRLLFANRAWETLVGLNFKEVRGHACRRRPRGTAQERAETILSAMAPPLEVNEGRACQVRRRLPAPLSPIWVDVTFLPLADAGGLIGIVGKMTPLPKSEKILHLPEKVLALRDPARYQIDRLHSEAPEMQRLITQIRLAAQTRLPAFLCGPRGAGKHWLARAIHQSSSDREKHFLTLDASRLPEEELAELLFDEDRLARMGIGTLYLQEPARLPREWQLRLSGILESQAPAYRLLVGSEQDPRSAAGRLVDALSSQVTALVIPVPPLKERLADLPWWVERFLPRVASALDKTVKEISHEALDLLRQHDWPGNLNELHETLVSACRRAKGERLDAADLPFFLRDAPMPPSRSFPLDSLLEQVERRLIALALKLSQGNKSKASQLLGIWRPRLLRRMEQFGLTGQSGVDVPIAETPEDDE